MDWLIGKSKKKEKEINGNIRPKIPLYCELQYCTTAFLAVSELKELIYFPSHLNAKEWIALQIFSDFCSASECPTMNGAGNIIYFWIDEKGKKNKLSAPHYIDNVLSHIQKWILDENIFPTKFGNVFPPNFECYIRRIIKWLFQVLSHIYQNHYVHAIQLNGLHSHLNTLLVHLLVLTAQVDRIDNNCWTETSGGDSFPTLTVSNSNAATAFPSTTTSTAPGANLSESIHDINGGPTTAATVVPSSHEFEKSLFQTFIHESSPLTALIGILKIRDDLVSDQ